MDVSSSVHGASAIGCRLFGWLVGGGLAPASSSPSIAAERLTMPDRRSRELLFADEISAISGLARRCEPGLGVASVAPGQPGGGASGKTIKDDFRGSLRPSSAIPFQLCNVKELL
jgi:hypothetical protein